MGGWVSGVWRWFMGLLGAVPPGVPGSVCATLSITPQVNATVSVTPQVNAKVTIEPC